MQITCAYRHRHQATCTERARDSDRERAEGGESSSAERSLLYTGLELLGLTHIDFLLYTMHRCAGFLTDVGNIILKGETVVCYSYQIFKLKSCSVPLHFI